MTIEYETSDRGFKRLAPIPGARYGHVRIYESSNAAEACVWVKVAQPEDLNRWPRSNTDPQIEAMTELPLEGIDQLIEQLQWIRRNHYQAED